jgi:CheY-like chemotaxis protein
MKTCVRDQMFNARQSRDRLNFALVIEEADYLRNPVITLLREQGWLVHGVSSGERAFSILAHIPYSLIVLSSELPGIGATDFVRIVRSSREWQTIQLVVINNSESANWESRIVESGALLARRSSWRDDLFGFLVADKENCGLSSARMA